MAALAVVEGLDVLEDGGPGLLAGGPGLSVDQFGLEGGEEALGGGIVPAGSWPADALAEVVLGQSIGVGTGEILGARSEWWIRPGAGWRPATAIVKASS